MIFLINTIVMSLLFVVWVNNNLINFLIKYSLLVMAIANGISLAHAAGWIFVLPEGMKWL